MNYALLALFAHDAKKSLTVEFLLTPDSTPSKSAFPTMRLVPEEISFSGSPDFSPIYDSHSNHEYQII